MNIVVVGLGYVGTSLAILLARHNSVVALDMGPLRSPSGAVREPCRPPYIFPRGSADWNLPVRRVCTV